MFDKCRKFLLCLALLGPAAVGHAVDPVFAETEQAGAAADYKQEAKRLFASWLERLWPEAQNLGVTRATFDAAFKGVEPDWSLPDLAPQALGIALPSALTRPKKQSEQAEFRSPAAYFPQKYISRQVRVGREKRKKWAKTLNKIERIYGVQPAAVMAIWGRETAFGRAAIPYYAVGALATLSFMGRRKRYFRREVLFALKILQDGHVTRAAMKSSWAGAMGHTQFLPSHFMNFAVDFDKDGKRDIWNSVPDALASAANYLSKRGWQRDTPWFYEVRLPRKFDCTLQGPKRIRTIAEWVRLGVKRTAKRKFPKHRLKTRGFLLLPAGVKGPAFIALKNFSVIKQYNLSDLYALFVGHLADRFTRDRGFVGRWPKLRNYSRAEVKRMQIGLNRLGHRSGRTDGIIGNLTRVSVGLYQKAAKRPLTCYPSRTDFDALVRAANR